MEYIPRFPNSEPLAGAIEVMFLLDGYAPDHVRERIVPNGRMTLVIELDGASPEYEKLLGFFIEANKGLYENLLEFVEAE